MNRKEIITKILICLLINRDESDVFIFKTLNSLEIFDDARDFLKSLIEKNILREYVTNVKNEDKYSGYYYSIGQNGIDMYNNMDFNLLISFIEREFTGDFSRVIIDIIKNLNVR